MRPRHSPARKKPRTAPKKKKATAKKPQTAFVATPLPTTYGRVLGLDVSSKTVGWCLFVNGTLLEYGKFHPKGEEKHHGEKLESYRDWLLMMLDTHSPDHVVVEMPYPGPRRNAYGVLMLYLGMLIEVYYRQYGHELPSSNRMTPRLVKQVLKARAGVSYETRKRHMVLLMNRIYKLALRYKAKDQGKVSDDDIADAIALTHVWHMLRGSRD